MIFWRAIERDFRSLPFRSFSTTPARANSYAMLTALQAILVCQIQYAFVHDVGGKWINMLSGGRLHRRSTWRIFMHVQRKAVALADGVIRNFTNVPLGQAVLA